MDIFELVFDCVQKIIWLLFLICIFNFIREQRVWNKISVASILWWRIVCGVFDLWLFVSFKFNRFINPSNSSILPIQHQYFAFQLIFQTTYFVFFDKFGFVSIKSLINITTNINKFFSSSSSFLCKDVLLLFVICWNQLCYFLCFLFLLLPSTKFFPTNILSSSKCKIKHTIKIIIPPNPQHINFINGQQQKTHSIKWYKVY